VHLESSARYPAIASPRNIETSRCDVIRARLTEMKKKKALLPRRRVHSRDRERAARLSRTRTRAHTRMLSECCDSIEAVRATNERARMERRKLTGGHRGWIRTS